jgi:PKHD-type hydroxylase
MLLEIPRVLTERELQAVRQILDNAHFVDGKLSAGIAAKRVQHDVYRAAALPMRVAAPFYARYSEGMSYGDHVDDPIMQAQGPYRSDISITIFLSEPGEYEGGELVVNTQFGPREVKLPAGYAVMYPSSSVHHVNEVTRGTRLVAVTWLQSLIRDPAKRELLYDLYQVREKLLASAPDDEDTKKIDRTYVNLVRMWGDV